MKAARQFADRIDLPMVWGCIVGLSMMRIPSFLFYTPIYAFALFGLVNRQTREAMFRLGREVFLTPVYFAFAIASLLWSSHPALTWHDLRGDIITPCLAFLGAVHYVRTTGATATMSARMAVAAWLTFLTGSALAYWRFGGEWINRLFDSVGYYSSYVLMLSALSLPLLTRSSRWLFYPMVAALLYLTQQRVAWVVFPCIGIADLLLNHYRQQGKVKLLLGLVVLLAFSYAMMKVVAESKPVDAFNPQTQASSLFERLAKNERVDRWRDWAKRGMAAPVVGQGFGRDNVREHYYPGGVQPPDGLHHGHNILLNNFLQLGTVGVLLYLLAQAQLLSYLIKRRSRAAYGAACLVVFFLLRNQFDDFSFQRLLVVYALILGWSLAVDRDNPERRDV